MQKGPCLILPAPVTICLWMLKTSGKWQVMCVKGQLQTVNFFMKNAMYLKCDMEVVFNLVAQARLTHSQPFDLYMSVDFFNFLALFVLVFIWKTL